MVDRPTRYTGSLFWPITAAISFFGTLSASTAFAPEGTLPDLLAPWVMGANAILFFVAMLVSGIAFVELLASGIAHTGTLTLAGRRLPDVLVGLLFLCIYLMPWGVVFAALTIWAGA
jgi:hypothetical protein